MSIRRPNPGVLAAAVIASLLAVPATSSASLVMLGPGVADDNALQAANRLLELTSPQSLTTESACVGWDGSADIFTCLQGPVVPAFTGGDQQPQSQTRTAGEVGITSGSDVRIAFDASEPGGDGITLDALRLLVLDPTTGALIFSADLLAPISLPSTNSGNGADDLLLALDLPQSAAFDAAVAASLIPLANVRIGIYANLSDATGGFEGFYIGNVESFGTGDIDLPEPASLLLIGAGLGVCARRFRRRPSNR